MVARFWPVLRLRTILFGTLVFVAALPGLSAVFLRVYENALVRRTEAELVAQSAALAASTAILWPGTRQFPTSMERRVRDPITEVDLRTSPIAPDRPAPLATALRADPDAISTAMRMAPAFAETKRTTLSSIVMLDRQGIIVGGAPGGGSLGALREVQAALSGQSMTMLRENASYRPRLTFEWLSRASNLRLHHARPIIVDGMVKGVVLTSRSPRALFRGMREDRGKIALGVILIFGMLIVLTGILARAIVRPIEHLSKATRALALGRAAKPVSPSLQVVEIRDLFTDFSAMAVGIDRRSRYLRDFAASLSHEFKTPLAAISGAIELLQDHGSQMKPAERAMFQSNMAADAQRLSRLVGRLMALAQADMQTVAADAQVDVIVALGAVADAYRSDEFAITIQSDTPLPPAFIAPDALESVTATLIENARQAGAQNVIMTAAHGKGEIIINVVDDGPGIVPADAPKIFDPFFTSKRADGGTGLGLPIAKSMVEAYQGSLTLVPRTDAGACFRVTLPTTVPTTV
jgi:signal transduction histidine kinase